MKKDKSPVRRTIGQMHKLPTGVRIFSIDDLNDAIAGGNEDFAIVLAGGGLISRKRITFQGNRYRVTNHIDESEQSFSDKQLFDERCTNIGRAMKAGGFVTLTSETGERLAELVEKVDR
jgi:hypothetical protein